MAGMSLPASASAPASANPACVINCVHYDDDGKRHDISLDAISDVIASGNGFVWVGLYDPNDDVLLKLQEEFCLHDLAIEDARNAHQRPKVETYGNSLFVVVTTAQMVDERIQYGETHAFLGPRFLVTVRHGASLSYAPVRARVEREPQLLKMGPSYCLYAVTDFVVDNYLPIVHRFRDTLDLLEKDIFADSYKRSTVVRLYELKRELNKMRMAVAPLQDVLAQLRRYQGDLIPDEVKLYVRDVHDHAVRISDVIDTLREMLGTALSVNLSLVTLAQGETVKRLGAWAALLAAPTLITSWYGMNFSHMPELSQPWSYPLMIVGVGGVCVGLYRLFKRAKWL
ncbi:magnesium and cobalt transport protein CorA [Stenotrophomonas maltophilia]|jgi:magnesium transporter|uniref:Magnesium and cobalt transport protein CorA n=3 Tax=Stenotrophomonas TaxID=40323 RepID=A0AA41CG17_STEMA|nr:MULTISPECIES: magnesium and cobalt transport protein CorA [Stenotrophomonas]AWB77824.1 magnesium and cobalt transport protein CorA [Stenotrophomonas maltophilia]CCH11976.1 Magnesium and cobalt transport protein CorA [Stenotrophomonas maltophilia D457]KKF88740.1 magnesium transporter CorA [Stenotrophomonas maltophilia]KLO00596.1 magnesium transporter CorA [Stenotrophomonas maltophilia]KOQ57588.1 magnesium transporter CorA [Stenotrophomonas maltophilia]